jgi:hypothetical protein
MLRYFRCKWPDIAVPSGEPDWLYYEVDADRDVVQRSVDLYFDGHAIRNSMKLQEREGFDARLPEFRSLVHGEFLGSGLDGLEEILDAEFAWQWDRATDKPIP